MNSREGLCDPSCTSCPLISLSHCLQSNPGLAQCQNTPILTTSLPRPQGVPKKPSGDHKKKNPKLHLKPRTQLKFTKAAPLLTNPPHLKISRGKGHQYVQCHLPKQRSVSRRCQVVIKILRAALAAGAGSVGLLLESSPPTPFLQPAVQSLPQGAGSGTQSLFFPYDE